MLSKPVRGRLDLVPGKGFKYIRGEIRDFFVTQTAIYGTILIEEKEYSFRLNNMAIAPYLQLGLDLIISNGYCQQKQTGAVVITDGKFGKATLEVNMLRYYKKNTITGKLISALRYYNTIQVSMYLSHEPFIRNYTFNMTQKGKKLLIKLKSLIGHIIRLNLDSNMEIKNIEPLPRNHFLYAMQEIKSGNLEKINLFDFVIVKQFKLVEKAYSILEELIFQNETRVSKTDIKELKDILYEKLYTDSATLPQILLIKEDELWLYFESLIQALRSLLDNIELQRNKTFILKYIKYFLPNFNIKIDLSNAQ